MINCNGLASQKILIQPELIPNPIPENRINKPILTFFHSLDNSDIDQVGHVIIQ